MFHTTHQSVTVRLLLILMSAGSPAAAAAAPHVLARAMMSGPAGLAGVCGPGAGANNPLIAADPLNPKRLVATYLIGANGDGVGIVAARSEDAGRTWRRTALEGMTRCEGGRVNFVGDPYLAYGPGEHVYIDASGLGEGSAPTADNLYLAASTDGGASYHRPIEPAAGHTSQRGAISPDPRHPGSLALEYESFDPISGPLGQTPWTVALASSHNSARTFATPRILETTQPGTAALAVALLRSRTVLVAISAEINLAESDGYLQGVPGSPLIEHVLARRSHNNGLTFGPPSPIGTLAMKLGDPGGCCLISTTQAADGTLYATWTALSAAGAGEVLVYRSHDTGATWQQLPVARTATRAFESSVATNPNGHVGVLWLQYAPGARGTAAATSHRARRHQLKPWPNLVEAHPQPPNPTRGEGQPHRRRITRRIPRNHRTRRRLRHRPHHHQPAKPNTPNDHHPLPTHHRLNTTSTPPSDNTRPQNRRSDRFSAREHQQQQDMGAHSHRGGRQRSPQQEHPTRTPRSPSVPS